MIADPAPFAYAGIPENQDAEIIALFHEWLDACRVLDENVDYEGNEDKEARYDAACDRQCDVESRIFELPAGPHGLAVKLFLHAYSETANWAPSCSQLRFEEDQDQMGWLASMLHDAAALVPEIGECAAAVIHADAVLIDADMWAQWARRSLSHPPMPYERPEHRAETRERLRQTLDCIANTPAQTPRGQAIKAKYASVVVPTQ